MAHIHTYVCHCETPIFMHKTFTNLLSGKQHILVTKRSVAVCKIVCIQQPHLFGKLYPMGIFSSLEVILSSVSGPIKAN